MSFQFDTVVAGTDVLLTKLNSLITKLVAYLAAVPGSSIVAGSVTRDRLSSGKAQQTFTFLQNHGPVGFAGTSRANADAMTVLNVDGASNSSYRITGWSMHCGTSATALSKTAGSQILVKVAGATVITIDLNDASLAIGTPLTNTVTAIAVTSGQVISIDYVAAGAPTYPAPDLKLFVTLNHVAI